MYTYTYLVCVRACVFVYSSVHTHTCGGPTHMCMGRSVCVCVCVCVGGGQGMCMDVRAARACLWDGVGVHAHVYMCVRNTACVYVFVEHRVSS